MIHSFFDFYHIPNALSLCHNPFQLILYFVVVFNHNNARVVVGKLTQGETQVSFRQTAVFLHPVTLRKTLYDISL